MRRSIVFSPIRRIVQAVETVAPPVRRNVSELIRQVKTLQQVRATTGEVMPSGWEPGKATLKTGMVF